MRNGEMWEHQEVPEKIHGFKDGDLRSIVNVMGKRTMSKRMSVEKVRQIKKAGKTWESG